MATKNWLLGSQVLTVSLLSVAVSCTSDKDSASARQDSSTSASSVSYTPGVAGGIAEETVTGSATVKAIDRGKRKVTLSTESGTQASFTVPPEVKNFDQIRVGDRVSATVRERLVVYVDSSDREPSAVHAAALATAPKGAKPGAISAESFEAVATVTAIDSARREATLRFADGQSKTIPVRSDVDLTKYKVGNSVVIQITQELSLLVEAP